MNAQSLSESGRTALLDDIHDRWFDLDQVVFNQDKREVVIPLGDQKKGPFKKVLTISGVSRVETDDRAQIGVYDVADLVIDVDSLRIVLVSGFPLQMTFHLEKTWQVVCAG